jgi:hypothetical protein
MSSKIYIHIVLATIAVSAPLHHHLQVLRLALARFGYFTWLSRFLVRHIYDVDGEVSLLPRLTPELERTGNCWYHFNNVQNICIIVRVLCGVVDRNDCSKIRAKAKIISSLPTYPSVGEYPFVRGSTPFLYSTGL